MENALLGKIVGRYFKKRK